MRTNSCHLISFFINRASLLENKEKFCFCLFTVPVYKKKLLLELNMSQGFPLICYTNENEEKKHTTHFRLGSC